MPRPRRKNDRLILTALGINTLALLVASWYLIEFRIMTNEGKKLNGEIRETLSDYRSRHRSPLESY